MEKHRVLFVCVHNSARSQMAEAFLRRIGGDRYEVESAGLEPGVLNPLVVEVMRETGIDLAEKTTRSVFDFFREGRRYHTVVTVCDEAQAGKCPIFPNTLETLHWGFPDPAGFTGTREERLAQTRAVRDRIEAKVKDWVGSRKENGSGKGIL